MGHKELSLTTVIHGEDTEDLHSSSSSDVSPSEVQKAAAADNADDFVYAETN